MNWIDTPIIQVDELPYDIDGKRVYKAPYEESNRNVLDGRPWKSWVTSSRKGFHGKRNVQSCKGSFVCERDSCPYAKEFGKKNAVQFVDVRGKTYCRSCNSLAKFVPCPAKKISEFPRNSAIATIYHIGKHTCTAIKRPKKQQPNDDLVELFKANPKVKPSSVANTKITSMIREGKSWSEIEEAATSMLDGIKIKNVKAKVVAEMHPNGQNFDAVSEMKKKTDERDKYFIWKINNGQFNNGQPSFVFKMSKEKAQVCIQMHRDDSDHPLSKEYCFLDAVHSRCHGYKTLTLWVWHPVLNQLVNLATMECENESSGTIQLFWNTLNEVGSTYNLAKIH